jgi:hypothetical protein
VTDNKLMGLVTAGGIAVIVVAAAIIFYFNRTPEATATASATTVPAAPPVSAPPSKVEPNRYVGSADAGGGGVCAVVGILLIAIALIAGIATGGQSPWHLETLPDGQQVWVRRPEASYFFFFWN